MAHSRGRGRRRNTSRKGSGDPRRRISTLSDVERWIQPIFAADDAEARGDARGALRVMEDNLHGPDGECFWKPWRIRRLLQIDMFGPLLPGWGTSRWILEQALFSIHKGRREIWVEAEAVALARRGGAAGLDGVDELDARALVIDRDWVFRQVALYDLGALDHFLRHTATPDLVAGADSIHQWAATPISGFMLVASTPCSTTWLDLADGIERSGPNIGSASMMSVGEHAIGRLVPIEGGHIFETQPVRVPVDLAQRVAADPEDWLDALSAVGEGLGDHQVITYGLHYECFLSDVPSLIWQLNDSSRPVGHRVPHTCRRGRPCCVSGMILV